MHYLVVTSSILKDGDLILNNNYENKDYFLHHSNEEKPTAFKGKYGELRPPGGILTSVILTPGYGLGLFVGKILNFQSNRSFLFFPRLTILIFHIFFSVILILFLRMLGFDKNLSLLCVILFLIQLPIINYSQAIYTDLLSGYFLMAGVLGVLLFAGKQRYTWLIMTSVLFGLCIFLHSKTLPLTVGLILSSLWFLFSSTYKLNISKFRVWFKNHSGQFWKTIFSIIGPWVGLFLISILMRFYWFGRFTLDGVENKTASMGLLSIVGNPLQGLLGQWLDIEVGLLPNAPFFALIFVGLFIWFKKNKSTFILIVPLILIYLVFNGSYYEWHAGFSPAGRYLLIVLPLLLPSIAYVLQASRKLVWLRWLVGILVFLSLILSSLIPFVGRRGLPYSNGYNVYWRSILKFLRLEFLESKISLNFLEPVLLDYIIGIIIFALLLGLGFYLQRKIFNIKKL